MMEAWATVPSPRRSTLSPAAGGVGRLLLNYMLSDPYVDVALVEGRGTRPREPRFVGAQQPYLG